MSWSVTFAIALTTTTGSSRRRPLTICAARSIAAASCTDVPPNFITIMGSSQGDRFLHQDAELPARPIRQRADGLKPRRLEFGFGDTVRNTMPATVVGDSLRRPRFQQQTGREVDHRQRAARTQCPQQALVQRGGICEMMVGTAD